MVYIQLSVTGSAIVLIAAIYTYDWYLVVPGPPDCLKRLRHQSSDMTGGFPHVPSSINFVSRIMDHAK